MRKKKSRKIPTSLRRAKPEDKREESYLLIFYTKHQVINAVTT